MSLLLFSVLVAYEVFDFEFCSIVLNVDFAWQCYSFKNEAILATVSKLRDIFH